MEKIKRCISRKNYLMKNNSNVGYALHVQDNVKKDDYARINTGEIVKVIGIRENKINKKAIYYNVYKEDWFDASAVENFSEDIIDLIELYDYINGFLVYDIITYENGSRSIKLTNGSLLFNDEIERVVTKERFNSVEFEVKKWK